MPTITRRQALAYALVLLALLALAGALLVDRSRSSSPSRPAASPLEQVAAEDAEALRVSETPGATGREAALVVHVAGAVRRPGLYRLPPGSRVDDAVRLAGGARRSADLSQLNLAAPVADGQQILVPRRAPATEPGPAGGSTEAAAPGPVSLNSATLEELDALPGIGPVTAQHILDYRAEHGAFQTVDELDAVPGIGPARLEQLRELVTL